MKLKNPPPYCFIGIVFAAALLFTPFAAFGITNEIDLTNNNDYSLKTIDGSYGVGGGGLVGNFLTQPAGTGVFIPFLTIEKSSGTGIESGYNTDGYTALHLDH